MCTHSQGEPFVVSGVFILHNLGLLLGGFLRVRQKVELIRTNVQRVHVVGVGSTELALIALIVVIDCK